MRRAILWAAVATAVLAVVWQQSRMTRAEQARERALAMASVLRAQADSLDRRLHHERQRLDSLIVAYDRLKGRPGPIRILRSSDTVAAVDTVLLADTVYAVPRPVAETLDRCDQALSTCGQALQTAVAARDLERQRAESLQVALTTQRRPTVLGLFEPPRIGVGGFAGLCTTGRPCAGAGFTVSIPIRF